VKDKGNEVLALVNKASLLGDAPLLLELMDSLHNHVVLDLRDSLHREVHTGYNPADNGPDACRALDDSVLAGA